MRFIGFAFQKDCFVLLAKNEVKTCQKIEKEKKTRKPEVESSKNLNGSPSQSEPLQDEAEFKKKL